MVARAGAGGWGGVWCAAGGGARGVSVRDGQNGFDGWKCEVVFGRRAACDGEVDGWRVL